MARGPRLAGLRRTLVTRRNGWALAAVLAILGILLGAQQLSRAADLAGQALDDAARLALDAGWLLLLASAAGLVLGLGLSRRRGRAVVRWLQSRLTTRPVRWGAAAVGVLVLLVLVLVVLPPRFTAQRHFDKASDELKAQNDVRTTLLQALAGGVLLLGAYFTWRQLGVTREGQITDRYTKAVDQLGSEHLDVRVGGIYALERIARDSPLDRATIEEVLTAYVRDHAPWPPPPALPSLQAVTQRLVTFAQRQRSGLQRRKAKDTAGYPQQGQPGDQEPPRPAADVQAAVTVLGRRQLPPRRSALLDLTGVDLRGASLNSTNLQEARLNGANLQAAELGFANLNGATLSGANLQAATLIGADLQYATLRDVNLQAAHLSDAKLRRAYLRGANLQGAWLDRANLQGADLSDADLQGATFGHADLQRVVLGGANLQDAQLGGANLQDTDLGGVNLQQAILDGFFGRANLQDALADEDTMWPAGWTSEAAKARGVQYVD